MKYQVMPDLSPEDYAELKADIQARGVQVAKASHINRVAERIYKKRLEAMKK